MSRKTKSEKLLLKLNECAIWLSVNGIITRAERFRIHQRLIKLRIKLSQAEAKP